VLDPLTREVLRHTNVMTRLALQCHARDGLLRRLRHYLLCNDNDPAAVHTNDATERSKDTPKRDTSKTPHTPHTPITPFSPSRGADPRVPLVLYGALGVGKTVVAARAAAEAKKDLRDEGCVVVRFCGTTMDSSTLHTLLRSIVQQLATVYTPAGEWSYGVG
jgi:Cdc6-like AAA superfamily ATPase